MLEQKRLENHEIYYIGVTLEIYTWRTSPRMEVPLYMTCIDTGLFSWNIELAGLEGLPGPGYSSQLVKPQVELHSPLTAI